MADDPQTPPVAPPAPVVPPAAPVAPPVPPPAPPVEGAPPAGAPASAAPPPPAPAEPQIPEAVFQRIDRLTKDKKQRDEQLIAKGIDPVTLEPIAPPPGAPPQPAAPIPGVVPAPASPLPADEIEAAARRIVAEQNFTNQCNSIAEAGTAAHPDFPNRMAQLNSLGVMSPSLITASIEVGDAHELLYALASDLNEANRIAQLDPTRQAIALLKFNEKRKADAAKHISNAPPPPQTLVDGGTPLDDAEPSAKDKSEDWFRKREKQLGMAPAELH